MHTCVLLQGPEDNPELLFLKSYSPFKFFLICFTSVSPDVHMHTRTEATCVPGAMEVKGRVSSSWNQSYRKW